MAITLTVQGITYEYPSPGEASGWGENATDWAQGVTAAVNGLIGTGDILPSLSTIANNQAVAANVSGLLFNPATVKSATVEYYVYRSTNINEADEAGTLYLIYRANTADWEIARTSVGVGGVTFTVTSAGQVKYTSTNITGTSYQGKMKFRARALSL